MREILFRGRTTTGKEWVSGFYAVHSTAPFIGAHNSYGTMLWFEVDPKTVGQFTGLTDKNGTKIFEGDILDYWSSYNETLCESHEVVVFGVDNCSCCHAVYGWSTKNKYGYGRYIDCPENCVVVGNIHDNPELLEG